jgi:hypothetical protein
MMQRYIKKYLSTMKLNKNGKLTGTAPKPKGEKSKLSHKWDLYQNGEYIDTYVGLTAISNKIGKSPQYCWQMAFHYTAGYIKKAPCKTKEGYTILRHGLEYGYWLRQDDQQ